MNKACVDYWEQLKATVVHSNLSQNLVNSSALGMKSRSKQNSKEATELGVYGAWTIPRGVHLTSQTTFLIPFISPQINISFFSI